jgi:hypothetical protein
VTSNRLRNVWLNSDRPRRAQTGTERFRQVLIGSGWLKNAVVFSGHKKILGVSDKICGGLIGFLVSIRMKVGGGSMTQSLVPGRFIIVTRGEGVAALALCRKG